MDVLVGMVRWRRIHPKLKEDVSNGVGFVRWRRLVCEMKCGIFAIVSSTWTERWCSEQQRFSTGLLDVRKRKL